MKYLQDYVEQAQTELFEQTGTFFAFSTKQFEEQYTEGVKYSSLGMGTYCPSKNVKTLINGLERIHKEGIKKDIAENGKENIIKRELANYESYYTGDYTEALKTLEMYGFTEHDVKKIFKVQYELEYV